MAKCNIDNTSSEGKISAQISLSSVRDLEKVEEESKQCPSISEPESVGDSSSSIMPQPEPTSSQSPAANAEEEVKSRLDGCVGMKKPSTYSSPRTHESQLDFATEKTAETEESANSNRVQSEIGRRMADSNDAQANPMTTGMCDVKQESNSPDRISTIATQPLEEPEEKESPSTTVTASEPTPKARRPDSPTGAGLSSVASEEAGAAARSRHGAEIEASPGGNDTDLEDMEVSEEMKTAAKSLEGKADADNEKGVKSGGAETLKVQTPLSKRRPKKLRQRDLSPEQNKCEDGGFDDDDDPHDLYERFVHPQRIMLPSALSEIRSGMKQSCWLWFVLPTAPYVVNGIERGSGMNRRYALRGDDAAVAYLRYEREGVHLRSNYYAVARAVLDQLERGNTMGVLFGPLDEPKAVSSFQLFERISGEVGDEELRSVCGDVLRLAGTKSLVGRKKKRGRLWKQRSY